MSLLIRWLMLNKKFNQSNKTSRDVSFDLLGSNLENIMSSVEYPAVLVLVSSAASEETPFSLRANAKRPLLSVWVSVSL